MKQLVIFDDIFFHPASTWRNIEYDNYYKNYSNVHLRSSISPARLKDNSRLKSLTPHVDLSTIRQYNPQEKFENSLAYTLFIHNAFRILPLIKANNMDLVFTLYPGGGFRLNEGDCNKKLQAVFSYKNFKKVIVTQQKTIDYLLEKGYCSEDKMEFIPGGVHSLPYIEKKTSDDINVCFVAHKYMQGGLNKGLDIFSKLVKKLYSDKGYKFHVVGNWNLGDLRIPDPEGRIKFYGEKDNDFFPEFYSNMDCIITPSRVNSITPGNFDGFPTGASVEAGMSGVAVFCTDPYGLNSAFEFEDGKDIVFIEPDVDDVYSKIKSHTKESLAEIGRNAKISFRKAYSYENQIGKRLSVINQFIE